MGCMRSVPADRDPGIPATMYPEVLALFSALSSLTEMCIGAPMMCVDVLSPPELTWALSKVPCGCAAPGKAPGYDCSGTVASRCGVRAEPGGPREGCICGTVPEVRVVNRGGSSLSCRSYPFPAAAAGSCSFGERMRRCGDVAGDVAGNDGDADPSSGDNLPSANRLLVDAP